MVSDPPTCTDPVPTLTAPGTDIAIASDGIRSISFSSWTISGSITNVISNSTDNTISSYDSDEVYIDADGGAGSFNMTVTATEYSGECSGSLSINVTVYVYNDFPNFTSSFYFAWAVGEDNYFLVDDVPNVSLNSTYLSSSNFTAISPSNSANITSNLT